MFWQQRKWRALVLALWLGAIPAFGVPVDIQSVTFSGNRAVADREIISWMSSRPGLPFSPGTLQRDLATIEENYRRLGYLGARAVIADTMRAADGTGMDVSILVTEGRPTVLGSLTVHGSAGDSAVIAGDFEARPGQPLDPRALEQDIDALLQRYERAGRPFARCLVDSMSVHPGAEEDTLDVALLVDEGPHVTLDEVRVQGNKETRANVILRETHITPGEVYDPARAEAIRRRLNKLNIFASVDEPELYLRDQHGGLLIRVREGASNTFDGVLGYVPSSTPGESGYFTGLASVAMRNLFGTGRKLQVRWQRESRRSEEFSLRYVEPWVLGLPLNLGGGFFQRQQDTTYIHRIADGRVELMAGEDLTAGVSLRSEHVIPSTDSLYKSPIPASSTVALGGDLQYDTRSDPISPSSGARYRIEYSFGRKHATASLVTGTGGGTSTVQRLLLDMEFYLSLFAKQVAAIGLHGYDVRGGDVGESDLFRFGGATTLRGYRENQFLGARVAWANMEYRFLMGRRSFFFLFTDAGYYSRPQDDFLHLQAAQAFKMGYGLGIRVDSPVGNLAVSFALGQGDTFSTAKIHVGLVNEF